MKQMRFLGFYCLGLLALALGGFASALGAHELSTPDKTTFDGRTVEVEVTLEVTETIQGFQAIAEWNSSVAAGIDFQLADGPGEALEGVGGNGGSGIVVTRVDSGFFVLGVVLDTQPSGPEVVLDPGTYVVGTLTLRGATPGETDIVFVDEKYSAAEISTAPTLDNIVVVAGGSLGVGQGLDVNGGTITVLDAPAGTLTLESKTGSSALGDAAGTALSTNVLLDSVNQPVQGYTLSIEYDSVLNLEGQGVEGTDAALAEFVFGEAANSGLWVAVVLDYEAPFEDQTVSGDEGSPASIYSLSFSISDDDRPQSLNCDDPENQVCDPPLVASVDFVDNVFGSPPVENLIVISGASKNPLLVGGELTFVCETCPPTGFLTKAFACGGDLISTIRSSAGEFEYSAADGYTYLPGAVADEEGAPGPLSAGIGTTVSVGFYYLSPHSGDGNFSAGDDDDVQAVQMAVRYGRGLSCTGNSSTVGTITDTIGPNGAEYVNVNCSNNGNGGTAVIAIQVDAAPPFDGMTLPPTSNFLKLIDVDFEVTEDAVCGEDAVISFSDGVTGGEAVASDNIMTVQNQSVGAEQGLMLTNCGVSLFAEPVFLRADCNSDLMVDISDSVAGVSFLFYRGLAHYEPACLDACDSNDDGRIDLADTVNTLSYLFKSGPVIPSPFPSPGVDSPAVDELTCEGGTACR